MEDVSQDGDQDAGPRETQSETERDAQRREIRIGGLLVFCFFQDKSCSLCFLVEGMRLVFPHFSVQGSAFSIYIKSKCCN